MSYVDPVLLLAVPGGWLCGIAADRLSGSSSIRSRLAITAGVVAMAIWVNLIDTPHLRPISYGLGCALIVLGVTDFRVLRLPDIVTLPLTLAGLALAFWVSTPAWIDRLVGAGLGYGAFAALGMLYRALRGRDGLGLGDAKLMAAAGAWLGWAALPSVVLLGSIGGLAWTALRLLRSRETLHQPLPFGVPLAVAFWAVWLYGPLTL